MELAYFSQINRLRCEDPTGFNHKIETWDTSDWFLATLGELGEAANVAKKLNRYRDGIAGNKESPSALREKIAQELADTFIYLDLTAQSLGLKTEEIIKEAFNNKSRELKCEIIL